MILVELSNIRKTYRGEIALDRFSLKIEAGERVTILGPSGCGKTTLLRLIAGFIAPDVGRISLAGKGVSEDGRILVPPEGRNLGMVFQDLALWPHLSVRGNIGFGLKAKKVTPQEKEKQIKKMLSLVGMEPYSRRKPAELSGGQQQRVALARALAPEPDILLMDEPLSNLDLELNVRLRKEILDLQEKLGFTLLYITHDRDEAFALGERIVLLEAGRIAFEGDAVGARTYWREHQHFSPE